MGTKSRETIYGASIRAAAERATEARKEADRLAVEAWNKRILGFQGPAQPSPALGDAINAGFRYLEVKCLGCNTHQTVALDIVRRLKARSMSWSDTCAARTARRFVAMPTSRAIWSRCDRTRFQPAIRPRRGGPESGERTEGGRMKRAKIALPLLAMFFLAMLSNGERFGHVAKAQTATSVLAAQIRSQGFACDDPLKATRDAKPEGRRTIMGEGSMSYFSFSTFAAISGQSRITMSGF
jgi:hypothetical protein